MMKKKQVIIKIVWICKMIINIEFNNVSFNIIK